MSEIIEKPGKGRPPLPPELVRSERVVTFVTAGEMRQLSELAKSTGKSLSTTACELLRESLRKQGSGQQQTFDAMQ